jgi:hypothetical protein
MGIRAKGRVCLRLQVVVTITVGEAATDSEILLSGEIHVRFAVGCSQRGQNGAEDGAMIVCVFPLIPDLQIRKTGHNERDLTDSISAHDTTHIALPVDNQSLGI